MLLEQHKIAEALKVIKQIESNNCQNVKHKSDAIGCYGLRPMALKQIGVKPPYKGYKELTQDLFALKYANHILTYTDKPSIDFLVYGWLNGPSAAKKRQKEYNYGKIPYRKPFRDHWYNKRFKVKSSSSNLQIDLNLEIPLYFEKNHKVVRL